MGWPGNGALRPSTPGRRTAIGNWRDFICPSSRGPGFARPIGLVMSRNLIPMRGVVVVRSTLSEAVEAAEGGRSVLHWLGRRPIVASATERPCNRGLRGGFAHIEYRIGRKATSHG